MFLQYLLYVCNRIWVSFASCLLIATPFPSTQCTCDSLRRQTHIPAFSHLHFGLSISDVLALANRSCPECAKIHTFRRKICAGFAEYKRRNHCLALAAHLHGATFDCGPRLPIPHAQIIQPTSDIVGWLLYRCVETSSSAFALNRNYIYRWTCRRFATSLYRTTIYIHCELEFNLLYTESFENYSQSPAVARGS